MQKAKIDQKIYDVISIEEFNRNPDIHSQDMFTAIRDGERVYPMRSKTDTRPGAYFNGYGVQFVEPTEMEMGKYSTDNVIDFSHAENLKEAIELQDKLQSAEREILTTVDSVFCPRITDADTPEMKGLKEAVTAKHIDLDKYEQRFGPNYNNDKRLFNRDSITMSKLKMMLNVLDMKGTLIIEDKADNVPNPIGRKIVVDLTENGYDDSEE